MTEDIKVAAILLTLAVSILSLLANIINAHKLEKSKFNYNTEAYLIGKLIFMVEEIYNSSIKRVEGAKNIEKSDIRKELYLQYACLERSWGVLYAIICGSGRSPSLDIGEFDKNFSNKLIEMEKCGMKDEAIEGSFMAAFSMRQALLQCIVAEISFRVGPRQKKRMAWFRCSA